MPNKLAFTKVFFIFMLAIAFHCAIGCHVDMGVQKSSLNEDSQPSPQSPPASTRSSSTEATIVHFVAERTEPPSPLSKGSFINENHAWVNDAGDVKRTVDGGASWQMMRPTPEDEKFFGVMRATYVRPYFITPLRGWLKAGSGTWQTEDGGVTWRRIFKEGSTPQFADEHNGWIDVFVTESSEQSFITHDGGETWLPCGPPRSKDLHLPGRSYLLTSQSGWAITIRTVDRQKIYGVARTDDGGCTWQQLWVSDESPDERYYDIYFIDERQGWLAGEFGLYLTMDGGKTWRERPLPAEWKATNVYFVNSNDGWIIASDREDTTLNVFYTSDSGKTWNLLTRNAFIQSEIPKAWNYGKLLQILYATDN